MVVSDREYGELIQTVKDIREDTKCLPDLCKTVAVHGNQIKTVQGDLKTISNRTWAAVMVAGGALIGFLLKLWFGGN